MAYITCRLCRFTCGEYKSLYDSNGEMSETLKIVIKYFHPSFLDSETEQSMKVICLECWQHISDFHSFHQWILNAQTQEEELKFIIKEEDLNEEITVSATNDFNYEPSTTNIIHSNESVSTESDCEDNENVSEKISTFKCHHCKDVFKSCVELDKHVKSFDCDRASNKESNTKLNIIEYNDESDNNAFKCDTCGASFTQYGSLRRHVRKVHTVQPLLKWICKYCNKLFKKRSLLQAHKNRLHNNLSGENTKNKTNEYVYNKDKNLEDSDAEVAKIYQEILNEEEKEEHATKTQTTTFSTKDDSNDEYIELDVDNDSLSMDVNKKQIHKPSLEIVDVKSEIATDEESDVDIKNSHSNALNSDLDETIDNDLEAQDADLECPRCNQLLRNFKQLKEHFDVKHPDERCYINCCHTVLYEPQSILEHLRYHENPNTFKCNECGKRFKGKKGLRSHKLQVHSEGRSMYHLHNCCCKKGVERHEEKVAKGQHMEYDKRVCCQRKKKILEDDQLIAKWRKELTCEICKAKFPYYSLMRSHSYYEHPGEKCYISCCQRKMSRISDTAEHIRFHLNPHLYRCQKCNKDFSGKSSLAKHMRNAHGGSLPKQRYACDECNKTFAIRFILTRHKNVCHAAKRLS